ncbi:MAG TPA: polysaccharide deacetylase family protein [bacterium]|nr:polysaccharide deacetylase family protein [bacterium]
MGEAFILCYHRVVEQPPADPFGLLTRYGLCVEVERFRGQMELLARHYRVVPLDELVASFEHHRRGPSLVAVTFDDGYADNYLHAFPVLQRVGIPATVFLATGTVGTGAAFWWDRLAWHLSRHAGDRLSLPPSLDGPDTVLESPEQLPRVFDALHTRLRTLHGPTRNALLDAIVGDAAPGSSRPLTWDEVRRMSAAGMTFGAHSVSHPSLVAISDAELRSEIERSRDEVLARVGVVATSFSYPFGYVDDRAANAVKAAGFRAAVTVRAACCDTASSRYLLPRLAIRDLDRSDFLDALQRIRRAAHASPRADHTSALLRRLVPSPIRAMRRHLRRMWRNRVFA